LLQTNPNPSIFIVKAFRKIARPLINLFISNGITYPVISELLKELYIEVADTEFLLAGKQQTDSRINFLTGIHRKDVKRLRNRKINDEPPSETASLGALLISRWLGDPIFRNEQGKPLALARLIKQGGEISFEALVKSTNKDIRSRAILDEWLNMNVVFMDENDLVCLNQNAFIPEQGFEEKTWFFAENLHDHIATATHNLSANSLPLLERAVYYDQLSLESVKELAELSEKFGMDTLIKINSHALALQNKDKSLESANHRIRLGLYFYDTSDRANLTDKQKKQQFSI